LLFPLIKLIKHRDAAHIGMGQIPWRDFIKWTVINLAVLIVVYAVFEPWSGAYAYLLEEATAPGASDPTFAWLTRFDGLGGWAGMFLFSGLISIFAEELFFRGWLQNALCPKVGAVWANVIQAALFTLPQLIVAFLMPTPVMSLVYGLVYAFGAIGLINGWVATKAGAIWPNLVAATLMNLILSVLILG
jgi:membrane protease YdiL (CAAX protease family)